MDKEQKQCVQKPIVRFTRKALQQNVEVFGWIQMYDWDKATRPKGRGFAHLHQCIVDGEVISADIDGVDASTVDLTTYGVSVVLLPNNKHRIDRDRDDVKTMGWKVRYL